MLQGLLGIFSGLITPVQTAVNTRLGRSIGSPLRASLVSFSVGLIAMLTLTLLLGPYPLIPATAANGPWWMWFAGVFGVTFLTGNVLLLAELAVSNRDHASHRQIVMGLLIDAFGWFGTTAQPISPLRIAGAAITLVGFLLAVAGPNLRLRPAIDRPAGGSENSGDSEKSETDGKAVHVPGSATVLWSCAGIAFGMCSAVQTALLGKLGVALGSPVKASLASFVVGLISLAIVVAFVDPHLQPRRRAEEKAIRGGWWGRRDCWGATLVMCNAYLSAHIGTGMTVMLVLLGQVGGGLLVDPFRACLACQRKPVAGIQYVGVLVAIVGIVLKAM